MNFKGINRYHIELSFQFWQRKVNPDTHLGGTSSKEFDGLEVNIPFLGGFLSLRRWHEDGALLRRFFGIKRRQIGHRRPDARSRRGEGFRRVDGNGQDGHGSDKRFVGHVDGFAECLNK
jgi:hypothetical protein